MSLHFAEAHPHQVAEPNDSVPKPEPELLTKEELRQKLNLPSTRMVDELVLRRKIPVIKLGHRTVRFNYERVRAALDKLEIKEVGRR